MKVTYLNGSPFKNGRVANILKEISNNTPDSYEKEIINVYDLNLAPCRGCMSCRKTGKCVIQDDIEKVFEIIQSSDVLIVGTPTYWSNMSGSLKIFFDRAVSRIESFKTKIPTPLQKGKNAFIVTSCSSPKIYDLFAGNSRGAINSIRIILKSGGYKIRGTLVHHGTLNDSFKLNPKTMKKAAKIGQKIK